MFIDFASHEKNDDNFSYILSKHPENKFERENKDQNLYGKFSIYRDELKVYSMLVINDPKIFLHKMKQLNLTAYNNYQEIGITPYNLRGFYEILRSAIVGNCKEVPDEEINRKRELSMRLGMFQFCDNKIQDYFKAYGFDIIVTKASEDYSGYFIEVKKIESIPKFLQQAYIISYFITMEYEMFSLNSDIIKKYLRLSVDWISKADETIYKNIIRGLCRNHKGFMEVYVNNLDCLKVDEIDSLKDALYIDFKGLHDLRHEVICDWIIQSIARQIKPQTHFNIVDYGCSNGKLIIKLDKLLKKELIDQDVPLVSYTIYGFDAKDYSHKFNRMRNIKINQMNLLYPNKFLIPDKIDFFICSEVIEHFERENRQRLMQIITQELNPAQLVITTPNIEYNQFFETLDAGTYRNKDHKIEMSSNEFNEEVLSFFENDFEKSIDFSFCKNSNNNWYINRFGRGISATHIIFGYKKLESKKFSSKINNNYYDSIYLSSANYRINRFEIGAGYCDRAYRNNFKQLFYMSPTVPPVEFDNDESDFLEHPVSAFKYFRDRGIVEILAQPKYMGSRATFIVFENSEISSRMGFKHPLTIISRNGYEFIYEETGLSILDEMYNEIQPKLKPDEFYIIDGEFLPWSYKAKGLIDKEFASIGNIFEQEYKEHINYFGNKESSFEDDIMNEAINAQNFIDCLAFKDRLKYYIQNDPIHIRMFDVLAYGTINRAKWKYNIDFIGNHNNYNLKKLILRDLETDRYFLKTPTMFVNLFNETSMQNNIDEWKDYCKKGGEGFVYKLKTPVTYMNNGYPIQPMLKVRGKEYLRLIYGMHYTRPDIFDIIKNRRIAKKRLLAIQQHELSNHILRAFLNGQHEEKNRLLAGFIGTENVSFGNVDKTL